jgi:O-antigen/teichoic acid export membrane protein
MSRSKSFAINSLIAAFLQIITMIVGMILPKAILVTYGSEINGLVSSVTQIVSYLMLVDAGLNGAAVYALYKPIAIKDSRKINVILSTVSMFYNKTGCMFLLLLLSSCFIYPCVVNIENFDNLQISILVFAVGLKGVLEFFLMGKFRALLIADQKMFVVSFASIVSLIAYAIIIITLAINKVDAEITYLVAAIAILLKTSVIYVYVWYKYKYLDLSVEKDDSVIQQRWNVLYLNVLGVIQRGAPIIALTAFASLSTVSIYSIYNMVIVGLAGILSIFASGLYASFGDVLAKNELQILKKAYSEFEYIYYAIITWVYSCSIILILSFVEWYTSGVKDAHYSQPLFGVLIVIDAFLYNLKTPQGMLVISAGLFKETRWQTTAQGTIALLACFVLSYKIGLIGAVLGIMLSNIYRDIDLMYFIPKYVTKLPVKLTLSRVLRNFSILSLCVSFVYFFPIRIDNIFDWLTAAIITSFVIFVLIFIVNYSLEPAVARDVLKRLSRLKQQW